MGYYELTAMVPIKENSEFFHFEPDVEAAHLKRGEKFPVVIATIPESGPYHEVLVKKTDRLFSGSVSKSLNWKDANSAILNQGDMHGVDLTLPGFMPLQNIQEQDLNLRYRDEVWADSRSDAFSVVSKRYSAFAKSEITFKISPEIPVADGVTKSILKVEVKIPITKLPIMAAPAPAIAA